MPITPPVTPPAPLSYVVLDLITDAFIEIGAVAPGESLGPDEGQWGFRKLNDLIDVWAAKRAYVYSYIFQLFTLQAGLSPHTIGPSGHATFNWPLRPVKIESSTLILNSGTKVDLPMNLRDEAWWAQNQVKDIQTNVPTDLYYDPSFEDGNLFFWPVPSSGNQVRLELWGQVAQFTSLQDPLGGLGGPGTLPPAYRSGLKLTLAEMLQSGAQREANPELARAALYARSAIFGNNAKSPRISTQDAGMPGGRSNRGDFNWYTGGPSGGAPE